MGNKTKTLKPSKTVAKATKPVKSFVDRALAATKEDNPENLKKFQERVTRYADRELQKIEDKLIDAKAATADAISKIREESLRISMGSITSVASINEYIPRYVGNIEDAVNAKAAKCKTVEILEARVAFFTTLKELVK